MKKLLYIFLVLIFTNLCLPAEALAQEKQNTSFFNAATKAYNAANYELAIDYYNKILENGFHSVAVYYNLGNAYYKQDKIALSIYYYEKALLLDPLDSEVLKNLSFAQKMTIDAIPTKVSKGLRQAYVKYISQYSIAIWEIWVIAFMLAGIVFYFIYYFSLKTALKRVGFSLSILFVLISLSSYINAWVLTEEEKNNQPAIVLETTKVLSEPNNEGVQAFELHEGTKVQVLESFNNWEKIKIADGQTGWAQKKQLKLLKD